jgi:hypothetical protein
MTIPGLEFLLVAGIVAFYVQDATLLLYHDEIVFERVARAWRPSVGGAQWSGRFLYVPGLLAPWRPLLRGSCTQAPVATAQARAIGPVLKALRPLQVGVTVLGALLLVGVPLLLWRYPHPLALLAIAAAIYATALLLAVPMWRRRDIFGIDGRTVAWMAFAAVTCPPHAINLVRKISLQQPLPADAMSMARASLDARAMQRLEDTLSERKQALAP